MITPPSTGSISTNRLLPIGALLINAFIWGVSWWPFQHLKTLGWHPLWTTATMYAICVVLLSLFSIRSLRAFFRQPGLWLLIVAAGATNVSFNWAITESDVVRVVLLFYLMPMWSTLLAWWLIDEKPTRASLLRLSLALMGVVLVLHQPGSGWPLPRDLADYLALFGGACFAFNNILLLKLSNTDAASRTIAMFIGGSFMSTAVALGVSIQAPTWGGVSDVSIWGVGLMSLTFLGGNLALQFGASRLPARTTALVMLSEVFFASATSIALGAARLELWTVLGGGLILLAAFLSAFDEKID